MSVLTVSAMSLIIILLPVSTLQDASYDDLWIAYKVKYKKFYDKNNINKRAIWEEKTKQVAIHNLEADMGLHSYRLELNKFSDMAGSELDVYRKCFFHPNKALLKQVTKNYFQCDQKCFESLPKSIDWRDKNLVTPVKDQKDCGSCWAFSSTGALEGQQKLKSGVLVSLSEQNLVDCSRKQGNAGCEGGWMEYAFQYVIDNNGIDTEKSYPYRGKNRHCRFIRSGIGANCTRYFTIEEGSEKHLQAAVANIGPIAVAIDASSDKFMSYKNGVFFDESCTSQFLDHAVLVVGYGTLNGTDFWIVKNSWGTSWGLKGYILMARNARNMCGISSHAVYPVV